MCLCVFLSLSLLHAEGALLLPSLSLLLLSQALGVWLGGTK